MATAVLDLELEALPDEVTGLQRYNRALILIRLRGRPVCQVRLTVADGRIGGVELRDAAIQGADWSVWEHWMQNRLGWEEVPETHSTPPKATVAVCTRDRPEELKRCLDALIGPAEDGQELLVVDNCPSSDATYRVVQRYRTIRYVREDRPGLNAARNRALREAQHDIVAFTDDDAAPDPAWLGALLRNFVDPLVMGVTGLTMPLELETEAQEWFEMHSPFGRGFKRAVYDSANLEPPAAGRAGAGANMALRRNVLELVGPFDEALDAGTPTRSGGDTEMFSRVLAAGYRIVYDPAALSWHRHRRTREELRATLYGYGVGAYAVLTRSLLVEGELSAPRIAWQWFLRSQFPRLARSLLRRPGSIPLDLLLAELLGCVAGPWMYLAARNRLCNGGGQ